ncbi:MAG: hypothetical protein K1X67_15120 [Fimbriimonadaceae bacterium]|nr:hypothetical protein [Fimbriimonadaceae bacterium]
MSASGGAELQTPFTLAGETIVGMAAHTTNLLDAHLEQVNARLKDASPIGA